MNELILNFGLIILAYLLGSISTAILTCKFMALNDPRESGSNNPGATNVKRLYGNKAAAITLFGDMLKGLLAVLIAIYFTNDILIIAIVAIASFLGHLYPIFFQFKGGKGVATALGAILGLSWMTGLATIATWLIVAFGFKMSSLAALVAFTVAPLYIHFFEANEFLTVSIIFISVLLFWRHRSNIHKIIKGTED